ncbi:hypothetical protein AGMMS49938_15350 [Fibrobacterales bacterium]|nr:hypothetical protein AGMMS49938_15350 [Fibrobacterales bacterium]
MFHRIVKVEIFWGRSAHTAFTIEEALGGAGREKGEFIIRPFNIAKKLPK